jgi:hypothetical protein
VNTVFAELEKEMTAFEYVVPAVLANTFVLRLWIVPNVWAFEE